MADLHKCVKCGKNEQGRFTRIKSGRSGAWTKDSLPAWWGYKCLPKGQGRGEEEDTPVDSIEPAHHHGNGEAATKASAGKADPFGTRAAHKASGTERAAEAAEAVSGPNYLEVAKVSHGKVQTQVVSLATEVEELAITDEDSYLYADTLLGRARAVKASWSPIWDRIQERVIKPQRAALEGLYELNRDIEQPATKIEQAVKAKMKAFKLEEARQLQASEDARQAAAQALIAEAQAKEAALQQAKTPAMRERLRAAVDNLTTRTEAVLMAETATPVRGESSNTRRVEKARIKSLEEFIGFLLDDSVYPPSYSFKADLLIMLNTAVQSRYTKDKSVGILPGVEVYTDIDIVGRG